MNAEIPRKEEQKASQHLSYFMDIEFASTGSYSIDPRDIA